MTMTRKCTCESGNCEDEIYDQCAQLLLQLPNGEEILEQADNMRETRSFDEVLNLCKNNARNILGIKV